MPHCNCHFLSFSYSPSYNLGVKLHSILQLRYPTHLCFYLWFSRNTLSLDIGFLYCERTFPCPKKLIIGFRLCSQDNVIMILICFYTHWRLKPNQTSSIEGWSWLLFWQKGYLNIPSNQSTFLSLLFGNEVLMYWNKETKDEKIIYSHDPCHHSIWLGYFFMKRQMNHVQRVGVLTCTQRWSLKINHLICKFKCWRLL